MDRGALPDAHFCSHPVLGTQMLRFLCLVLTARAVVNPPTEFLALENGKPVQQLPVDRISKLEVTFYDSDPESHVDRGFIEEYRLTKGV